MSLEDSFKVSLEGTSKESSEGTFGINLFKLNSFILIKNYLIVGGVENLMLSSNSLHFK